MVGGVLAAVWSAAAARRAPAPPGRGRHRSGNASTLTGRFRCAAALAKLREIADEALTSVRDKDAGRHRATPDASPDRPSMARCPGSRTRVGSPVAPVQRLDGDGQVRHIPSQGAQRPTCIGHWDRAGTASPDAFELERDGRPFGSWLPLGYADHAGFATSRRNRPRRWRGEIRPWNRRAASGSTARCARHSPATPWPRGIDGDLDRFRVEISARGVLQGRQAGRRRQHRHTRRCDDVRDKAKRCRAPSGLRIWTSGNAERNRTPVNPSESDCGDRAVASASIQKRRRSKGIGSAARRATAPGMVD